MITPRRMLFLRYQYDAIDRLISHRQFNCQAMAPHQEMVGVSRINLLATDKQNSVLWILQADERCSTAYTPYGYRTSGSGFSSFAGFNGVRPEPITGHYLLGNGYRAYNPILMRFNSPDNLSPFDVGGINPYAYCQGDPVNKSDPTGHVTRGVTDIFYAVKAKYKSITSGAHYKPIKNFTKIADKAAIFEDHVDGRRLTIFGHGDRAGQFRWRKGELIGPEVLYENLKAAGVQFKSYDSVRLLYCNSGARFKTVKNPAGIPFGQSFSNLVGLDVKAYEHAIKARSLFADIKKLQIGETSNFTRYSKIEKKDRSPLLPWYRVYSPVTFLPESSQAIRRQ
ncbi:RHS repeat-associated core domain-containing protein [Pseudomonas sp. LB3P31]